MRLKTTVFAAARARGWSIRELSERSGIPISTLYAVEAGTRFPGAKFIAGAMRAFPDLPFERLFVPEDSTFVLATATDVEPLSRPAEPAGKAA